MQISEMEKQIKKRFCKIQSCRHYFGTTDITIKMFKYVFSHLSIELMNK